MPAFLSHSSKDANFVDAVASAMGPLEYELDRETFEYTLNVRAIRNALLRADIAVFFVSKHSINSTFVSEEQRQTLENLGRGIIKKVLIFAIDDTSYSSLPDWMRDINVAQRMISPQVCARRIQASLLEIAFTNQPDSLYLGRDEDEKKIRKALRVPAADTPNVIHIAGFNGIGRRTYLRETLKKIQPGRYISFPSLSVGQYTGEGDIYRALYRMVKFTSSQDQLSIFSNFESLASSERAASIADLIKEMADNRELLIVYDEGNGVLNDSGELFEHWQRVINILQGVGRPVMAFIQTRSQPMRYRLNAKNAFHQRIEELDVDSTREIISFSLKEKDIDYTESQINDIVELCGGHPFNIRIAVNLADAYKVTPFLANPGAFISWRDRRGAEFLAQIGFSEIETEIMAVLIDYRYLATEAIIGLVDADNSKTTEALLMLQDFFCVEFRDGVFSLSTPIREAARRDERFIRTPDWHRQIAENIINRVQTFASGEEVPLSLFETAAMAAVRSDKAPEYIKTLVLPSHLLMVAREHYDEGRRSQCIALCKQAYEYKRSMTSDAQIETLRIWALSAARLDNREEFGSACTNLSQLGSRLSVRTLAFVKGFQARLRGKEDEAEAFFKSALELSPTNGSINRELAKLFSNQRLYSEAEGYAREAYNRSQTNPYVIDIMLEILEGKKAQGLSVDVKEISKMRSMLESYGNEPGFSFHSVREAQRLLNNKDYEGAISAADLAIASTPKLHAPYLIKIEAQLHQPGDIDSAEKTLEAVKAILADAGVSEGASSGIAEAEVQIMIARGQYSTAKSAIESQSKLPHRVRKRLFYQLSRAISFSPSSVSRPLQDWAKTIVST